MQLTKAEISTTQFIVTTPEKWDVVTRKGTGDVELAQVRREREGKGQDEHIILHTTCNVHPTNSAASYYRKSSYSSLMKSICCMKTVVLSLKASLPEH